MIEKLDRNERESIYSDAIKLAEALFGGGYQYSPNDAIRNIYDALKTIKEKTVKGD